MNKKGFTTVELIVSFVMVVVLLGSLIGFTITYRDKVKVEEVKSQLMDFKNLITKTVYDDIIALNYNTISACVGIDNCVVMTDENGLSHVLKVENTCNVVQCSKSPCELNGCGVYLVYNEIKYLLPDSNLNSYYKQDTADEIRVSKSASNLFSFNLRNENSIYSLKMTFKHFEIKDDIEILITIN